MAWQRVTKLPAAPSRPDDAHKGTFGRVLVVAGGAGMSGAAALCGLGALRGGAGLVYVAAPRSLVPTVASIEPSYLTVPLPEDEHGRICGSAQTDLAKIISQNNVVAAGPGWGQSTGLQKLAHWMFTAVDKPIVFDADGLNALASHIGELSNPPAPRILTPHPGEFSRLTGRSVTEIQNDRENLAGEFAKQHHVILLLKGPHTVITDGEHLAINQTGNSGMSTGGTGDVLTGLIAALLAQQMEPFEAACLGAHLHGLAGNLAAAELTKRAMIASDLARFLSHAWKQFESAT